MAVNKVYYESGKLMGERHIENDVPHRLDGPACIYYLESGEIETEYWYCNGKFHRELGPAIVHYYNGVPDENGSWYHHGNPLSFEQVKELTKKKPR